MKTELLVDTIKESFSMLYPLLPVDINTLSLDDKAKLINIQININDLLLSLKGENDIDPVDVVCTLDSKGRKKELKMKVQRTGKDGGTIVKEPVTVPYTKRGIKKLKKELNKVFKD